MKFLNDAGELRLVPLDDKIAHMRIKAEENEIKKGHIVYVATRRAFKSLLRGENARIRFTMKVIDDMWGPNPRLQLPAKLPLLLCV
jgi:hypothetical protein